MRYRAGVKGTFLEPKKTGLRDVGISEEEAARLRACLAAFAEDWDIPEMEIYDDYDIAKTRRR